MASHGREGPGSSLRRWAALPCRIALAAGPEEPSNIGNDGRWFGLEPPMGQSKHAIAGYLEDSIAAPITLERSARLMEATTVEFDDQPFLSPQDVYLQTLDPGVGGRYA
jgi:hypothetical protein